jgi:hypothetical protein
MYTCSWAYLINRFGDISVPRVTEMPSYQAIYSELPWI